MTLPRPLLSSNNLEVSPPDVAATPPAADDEDVEDNLEFDENEVMVEDELFDVEILLFKVDTAPLTRGIVADDCEVEVCDGGC